MQLLEGLDADTDALGVLSWYAVDPCLHKLALATSNATLEIRAVPQRRSTAGPVTSCRVAGGPLQRAIGHQKAVGDITRKKKYAIITTAQQTASVVILGGWDTYGVPGRRIPVVLDRWHWAMALYAPRACPDVSQTTVMSIP